MPVAAGAFLALIADFAEPEKFDTALAVALFLPQHMVRGDLEIEPFVRRMLADKQVLNLVHITDDVLHMVIIRF